MRQVDWRFWASVALALFGLAMVILNRWAAGKWWWQ